MVRKTIHMESKTSYVQDEGLSRQVYTLGDSTLHQASATYMLSSEDDIDSKVDRPKDVDDALPRKLLGRYS